MINLHDVESIDQINGRGTVIAVDTRKYPVPFTAGMHVSHENTIFVIDGIEMSGMGDHVAPIVGLQVTEIKGAPKKNAWRFHPVCPWCGEKVGIPHHLLAGLQDCSACDQVCFVESSIAYRSVKAERPICSDEIEED